MDAEEYERRRPDLSMDEEPSKRKVAIIVAVTAVCLSILGWLFFFM